MLQNAYNSDCPHCDCLWFMIHSDLLFVFMPLHARKTMAAEFWSCILPCCVRKPKRWHRKLHFGEGLFACYVRVAQLQWLLQWSSRKKIYHIFDVSWAQVQQVLLRLVYRSSSAMKQRDAFVWLGRCAKDYSEADPACGSLRKAPDGPRTTCSANSKFYFCIPFIGILVLLTTLLSKAAAVPATVCSEKQSVSSYQTDFIHHPAPQELSGFGQRPCTMAAAVLSLAWMSVRMHGDRLKLWKDLPGTAPLMTTDKKMLVPTQLWGDMRSLSAAWLQALVKVLVSLVREVRVTIQIARDDSGSVLNCPSWGTQGLCSTTQRRSPLAAHGIRPPSQSPRSKACKTLKVDTEEKDPAQVSLRVARSWFWGWQKSDKTKCRYVIIARGARTHIHT